MQKIKDILKSIKSYLTPKNASKVAFLAILGMPISLVVGKCRANDTVSSSNVMTDEELLLHYGDTLYCDGNTTYIQGDMSIDRDYLINPIIVTYKGDKAKDTCVVENWALLACENGILKAAVGVDTSYYDITKLPKRINPIKDMLPIKAVEHKYSHKFAINDSSEICHFDFHAYLPKNVPIWTKQFISIIMSCDISDLYNGVDGEWKTNKDIESKGKPNFGISNEKYSISGIDAYAKSPKEIAAHFSRMHERLYRKCFDEVYSPSFDYAIELAPVWTDKDGKYITYRIHTYNYLGGLHGFYYEYYFTFDAATGEVMGGNDFIKKNSINAVSSLLEDKVSIYKYGPNYKETYPPYFESDGEKSNDSDIYLDTMNGHDYPRPALTKRGIVFSYQPYEIGPFCDGILHFLIPYSALKKHLNIKM